MHLLLYYNKRRSKTHYLSLSILIVDSWLLCPFFMVWVHFYVYEYNNVNCKGMYTKCIINSNHLALTYSRFKLFSIAQTH